MFKEVSRHKGRLATLAAATTSYARSPIGQSARDEPFRREFENFLEEPVFRRRGKRKAIDVDNCHEFRPLASLRRADPGLPFSRPRTSRQRSPPVASPRLAPPPLESPVAGLVVPVARGEVLPSRTSPQNPENSVQTRTRVFRRSALAIVSSRPLRDQRLDQLPMLVRQVHRLKYKHLFERKERPADSRSNFDHLRV